MRSLTILLAICTFGWLLESNTAQGQETNFKRDILPILENRCIDCHGPDTQEANLRLDSTLSAMRGGDSGEPAVVPGDSKASYIIARVLSENEKHRMPPDSDPLPAAEVNKLRRWIDDAEHWREAIAATKETKTDHWSFQPLTKPTPPGDDANPIDAFIDAKRKASGLHASAPASRRQLVRRAYLVMHGLPPTPAQTARFENDTKPDAWPRLVKELLASPQYGERLATVWLDLVHFGETNGYETNRERPNAWRYRDWVIDSFNADKPYDQFIVEQLAGDAVGADVATGFLVAGPNDIVKGQDPQLRLVQRQDELADMIHTTGASFLGLTLGCARCHNHKFDPVSQTDFYAMQAVFAGVVHADRPLPDSKLTQEKRAAIDAQISDLNQQLAKFRTPPNAEVATLRDPVNALLNVETFKPQPARFVRFTIDATNQSNPCIDELEIFVGKENVALASAGAKATSGGDFVHEIHKLAHINDGRFGNAQSWIAKQPKGGWVQIELAATQPVERIVWARDREGQYQDRIATKYKIETSLDGKEWETVASSANRKPFKAGQASEPTYYFDAFSKAEAERGKQLLKSLTAATKKRARVSGTVKAYAGKFVQPGPTHRLYRGEPTAPREAVAPAAIASLSSLKLPAKAPEQKRRLAIARWIADEKNPLTARVMVNRIWQFHFGSGIVSTSSDFGGNGAAPSHPELLDWLANELIENGWSLKHIHRLILTSQTWRQASFPNEDAIAIDADSRLLWRFPPRRLSAEAIRDSILATSGKLDLQMGGPGFSAFEVDRENVRHYFPKTSFGPEDWRRMIYMTRVRQERDAVFGVFDCPDFSQVVPQRTRSTTPLQALNLFNSQFVWQQADLFTQRLHKEAASEREQVALAYELCFSRPPSDEETTRSLAFIHDVGWRQFARAMLNANEFVFIP